MFICLRNILIYLKYVFFQPPCIYTRFEIHKVEDSKNRGQYAYLRSEHIVDEPCRKELLELYIFIRDFKLELIKYNVITF